MPKLMRNLYDNLDKAKAFAISFTNFAYFYNDLAMGDSYTVVCEECQREIQHADYLMPRSSAKKDTAILHSCEPGVSPTLRDELIARFDITEADFRPVRTKKGEIIYYQLTPQHVMLPIHEINNWVVEYVCPKCGNVRYHDPDREENSLGEPFYRITQEILDHMHDLNVTCEHQRQDSVEYVISRRVYDFLIERYPRTHYFPFYLEDDI